MGNAEGKRRDVTVELCVRDSVIGILYRETLANKHDTPAHALVEIPMDDALVTDWKVKQGDRRVVSTVHERSRRTFVLSGDAQEEMLLVDLGELAGHAKASVRLRAVAPIPRSDARRVAIRIPWKTVGDDVDSLDVCVEATFTRPVAAVSCASHAGMRVAEGATPGDKRVTWRSTRGFGATDWECVFEFESEFTCDAIVETSPDGTRVCMLSLFMQKADLRLGNVVWPKSFGCVMQIPDSPRELAACEQACVFAFFDGDPSPEDIVVWRGTTTMGAPYTFQTPLRFTKGVVIHKLAAREEIAFLMSGASVGTQLVWKEEQNSWLPYAQPSPCNPTELRRRVITLGLKYQVTSPYTAFMGEDFRHSSHSHAPMRCDA
eukprot:m51a1_g3338 hypothetical protein (376) ;mRNA; f:391833-393248